MGKQKATFDQLFPTYTYTVYYYKLLQRSKTNLSSWHWTPAAVSLLDIRKATASVGPTSISGLRARRPLTRLSTRRFMQATWCCHLLKPATHRPRFPFFLPRPKEFKPSPVRLVKSKCVSMTGRLFDKRSCYLCCHFLVVWNCTDNMIPEQRNQLPW